MAAVTLAAALLLIWHDRDAQMSEWSRNLANVSTSLAAHAEQSFRAADLVLEAATALVHASGADDADALPPTVATLTMHEALRAKMVDAPQVDVVSIVSAKGDVLNFTRSFPPPPINLADRDFFRAIMLDGVKDSYLSAPVENRGNGRPDFYLARPIPGRGGRPIGVMIAGISTGYFGDFYRLMRLGDYSAISLFRSDGVLLAREPMLPGEVGQSFAQTKIFQRMKADAGAVGIALYDDPSFEPMQGSGARLIAPRKLSNVPVISTVTVPESVILSGWRQTAQHVMLLTMGLIAAMLSLTFVLARLIDRQENTLQDLLLARQEAEAAAAIKGQLLETLRASEAQLTEQSKVLQITLEHIEQGLLMVAADGTVPVCNRRAIELLNLPPDLMATRPPFSRIVEHQRSIGEFVTMTISATHTPGAANVLTEPSMYERTRPNGAVLEVHTIPLPGGGMVRTFSDISARRKSEEQIRYYAHHDGLTELVNRMVFQQRLADALGHAERNGRALAVHYLDLDGFKLVNDTHGHGVGDRLLVEVADRLRRAVRDSDTVGRMGGDEFAILQILPERPSAVEQLAQRILKVVNEPYMIGGITCLIGLSIGIARFPEHGRAAESLMRDADAALYRAKADGKGGYCIYDETMDRRHQEALQLEQELKLALANDELFLEYQPIVDAATLEPASFEALLRWQRPGHGVVSPGAFIAIAERSGLIVPIGAWVLETACREATRWPPGITLSVNVSPVQFSRGDLPGQVVTALARSGLPPGRLTLEVTEGVLLEENNIVLDAMSSLRATGVRFSLDDFGTANSRLAYLRRFPFDVIKIDRSFVEDVVEQEGARAIVSAVMAIGRAFHLTVIAEGVEREDQLVLMRSLGCPLIQGYLTGAPRPVAILEAPAQTVTMSPEVA